MEAILRQPIPAAPGLSPQLRAAAHVALRPRDILAIDQKRWRASTQSDRVSAGSARETGAPTLPDLAQNSAQPLRNSPQSGCSEVRSAMSLPPPSTVEPSDDALLLERFRLGDRDAFADLVQRYQRQVYYLVWRYVRNEEDAKDVTQATFVRAWRAAATFRGESSIRTWLYRIGVNLALNHVRDRGRWQASEVEPEALPVEPGGIERLVLAHDSQQLRQAVAQLPPKQRLVVELRVQEDMSFREVADVAECSEDAAKANFHHAIKRLRAMLGGGREH